MFAIADVEDVYEETPEDTAKIRDMLVPLSVFRAKLRAWRYKLPRTSFRKMKGNLYTCRHWDGRSGLCTIYEDRPQMCRIYPVGKCQHGCGLVQ